MALACVSDAQSFRVRVIDRDSRAPIAGAIVSLLSEQDGTRIRATLSDELGMALLEASGMARVKIQVDRIGYATTVSAGLDATTASGIVEVELTERSLQLPTVAVKARQTCQDVNVSPRTAALWQEVQKALSASLLSTRHRSEMSLWRYTRTLDRDLRVLAETTSVRAIAGGAPFTTAPAEQLSREGFVQELDGTETYFAPDAALLLSSSFVTDHCFSTRAPATPGEVVGLTFRPLPARRLPEVSGVLWLNSKSGELLWLDYSYVGVTGGDDRTLAGGRLDFSVLPDGQWIIERWYIRIPRRAIIPTQRVGRMETAARDTVIGYREEGGWVVMSEVRGAADRSAAFLAGLVYDSTSMRPLAGARVSLARGAYQTLTDSTGRYRIRVNLPGRYVVTMEHSRLSALGIPYVERDIAVSRATTTTLDFGVPAVASLRAQLCPATPGEPAGVVLAQVFDSATQQPLSGVRVTASWRNVGLRRPDQRAIATLADSALEVTSNVAGVALICGRPVGERLTLRADVDGRAVARSITVTSGDSLVEVRLALGAARGRENAIRGVVSAGSGTRTRPLAGAEVLLPALQLSARTRGDGSFTIGRLAEGRHAIVIRSVGFQPVLTHVQLPLYADSLLAFVLEPLAPELTPVLVRGRASGRGRMSEFEERRATTPNGTFLTRDDLEKREHSRLSDVLRSVRGLRVQRLRNGSEVVLSSRSRLVGRSGRAQDCYYQIYLDGIRVFAPGESVTGPPDINSFAPAGLEAIEIFAGPAVTPPKFGGLGAECGTIVLWTRGS